MPIVICLTIYADNNLVFLQIKLLPLSSIFDASPLVGPSPVDELELLDVRAACLASDCLDAGHGNFAEEARVLPHLLVAGQLTFGVLFQQGFERPYAPPRTTIDHQRRYNFVSFPPEGIISKVAILDCPMEEDVTRESNLRLRIFLLYP